MGAAFLCAIAGIANEHTDRNTTAYIQNWIEKLEEDNRLIVHAAANAQRAVDLILCCTFEEEKQTSENAGDAAVSGIPAAVAMNIAPADYGLSSLSSGRLLLAFRFLLGDTAHRCGLHWFCRRMRRWYKERSFSLANFSSDSEAPRMEFTWGVACSSVTGTLAPWMILSRISKAS
jgi:hypothetical protein